MSEAMDQVPLLRELLVRVAALEENVSFLEMWCEEQQDALDVVGAPAWPSEDGVPAPRLYAVDLRDGSPDAGLSGPERLAGGQEVVELHQDAPGAGVEPAV
jgi:hypothetical protein